MATRPGRLKKRDDHKEEPLLFLLRKAIGAAAGGTLLGRAMACCACCLSCVFVWGGVGWDDERQVEVCMGESATSSLLCVPMQP